jgi:hypothetical protein
MDGLENTMLKVKRTLVIGLTILLVIAWRAGSNANSTPIGSSNQMRTFDPMDVMHADAYWSPLEECPDEGLTDGADCRQAHLPSLHSALDRIDGTAALNSKSSLESVRPSADAPQVSEKPSQKSFSFTHYQDKATPLLIK